ncbi:MAG: deoxynucleoside kinase [Bacteroidota bacterium]|nr:deoxynucleoside kinase [Saprospirales bacterium]MEC7405716.1 deoxynucleoside kinase [Bacteroidota bacterium]MEC8032615.1 deoxynucleoside kinase [Bacteroidota bacterium]MEC8835664.1 deoxynucleoside kinase [Bacteroidota bacterium]|tara:strand:- start:237 stop:860 length:624 start_codon:yes stop_codon:yes gene_type:complete
MDVKHIAVSGNIGAGKTTLVQNLSHHFDWTAQYEEVESNPYLDDFYSDMHRWAFNLQIFFLHQRYSQILEIREGNKTIIQDRTIYEDAAIFAPNLHKMGLMSTRDYENYKAFYKTVEAQIQPPDLLIYMKASIPTLVNNIQKRGRDYEENLRLDYLKKLNEFYENWIASYDKGPLLVIDCDNTDIVENKDDISDIYNRIQAELNGLF